MILKLWRYPTPWKPLDAKISKAITEVFVAALQDPFKRYYGQKKNEKYAYYPVQEQATRGLQHMGLRVVPRATQTTIENENGQILKTLPFKLKQGAKFRS